MNYKLKKGVRKMTVNLDWTKEEAMAEVIRMGQAGEYNLSTGMCEALGISFDSFLKFAQCEKSVQKTVVKKLAGILELHVGLDKFGHCGQ